MTQTFPRTRAQAFQASEDIGRNPTDNPTIGDIIAARFHRRDILKGALGVAAIAATVSPLAIVAAQRAEATGIGRFSFKEVAAGVDDKHHVADGYDVEILARWGDPVLKGASAFDPMKQTAAAQKMQFGYNNDYVGYVPMPGAANPSQHGLLVINHEYTNEELMFPGIGADQAGKEQNFAKMTKDLIAIEKAAHGGSVLEIKRDNGKWGGVASRYARRIDADTPIDLSGPAAGSDRMKTKADPTGRRVLGMLNNCAGGVTPWGTWLTCEENFNGYFGNKIAEDHPQAKAFKRYGVPSTSYAWFKFEDRFDLAKEPNEPNRFGWVVEIDPFDPISTPKKRTALGRFKHEGAANIINKDGRFVVYQGDDERFDYVYKFVTRGTIDRNNRVANMNLLDEGTLFVAKYNADGSGEWLPLVQGQGPLIAANGFNSQADVVIDARLASDLLGATKMDRPEDVEVSAKTNKIYVILTNNNRRKPEDVNAANPRADNKFGHIVEMIPAEGDHTATKFTWDILVKCGDPSVASVGATFSQATSKDGWFGMPDMAAIDAEGRLWIGTDGNSDKATGRADGLWGIETEGRDRATSKLFFRCPAGAELCGPEFTPDTETLFVAIQHPGDDGDQWKAFGRVSNFEDPSTRWPDFKPGMPPRPSVLAITKRGGGKIGT